MKDPIPGLLKIPKPELPGWRILKTGIAVCLALWIAQLLNLQNPFFCGFAAVFAMQSTVEGSLKEGLHRMQGTIFGALLGYLFSLVMVGNPLWTAFGLIVMLYLLKALKWTESMTIASMVFIVILVDSHGDQLNYAIVRTLDTGLGIVIAYIVNRFVAPPKPKKEKPKSEEERLSKDKEDPAKG